MRVTHLSSDSKLPWCCRPVPLRKAEHTERAGHQLISHWHVASTQQLQNSQVCPKGICSTLTPQWRSACPMPELSLLELTAVCSVSVWALTCSCSVTYVTPLLLVLLGWPCWTHNSPKPCISLQSTPPKSLEQTQKFSTRSLLCQCLLSSLHIRARFNCTLPFLDAHWIICQAKTLMYISCSPFIQLDFGVCSLTLLEVGQVLKACDLVWSDIKLQIWAVIAIGELFYCQWATRETPEKTGIKPCIWHIYVTL